MEHDGFEKDLVGQEVTGQGEEDKNVPDCECEEASWLEAKLSTSISISETIASATATFSIQLPTSFHCILETNAYIRCC